MVQKTRLEASSSKQTKARRPGRPGCPPASRQLSPWCFSSTAVDHGTSSDPFIFGASVMRSTPPRRAAFLCRKPNRKGPSRKAPAAWRRRGLSSSGGGRFRRRLTATKCKVRMGFTRTPGKTIPTLSIIRKWPTSCPNELRATSRVISTLGTPWCSPSHGPARNREQPSGPGHASGWASGLNRRKRARDRLRA